MRRFLPCLLLLPGLLHAAEKEVPPELLKALEDREPPARIKAIKALSKLGLEAVPPLVKALRDEESQVSQSAAYALGLIRGERKAFVAALGPHLKDRDTAVRKGVAAALGKGGPDAVGALQVSLADKEPAVRRQAVLSLEVIVARTSAAAKEVLPGLSKLVNDDSAALRVDLTRALSRCGPDALVPLLALADDADAKVRAYALAALMRPLAGKKEVPGNALAVLAKKAKDDPEVMVRQSALRSLGALGKPAVAAVTPALADREAAVQKAAVQALVKIGKDAAEAVPALKTAAMKSDNADVRGAAVLALGKLGKEGEQALLGLLGRDDSATRLACLQHLGKQGKAPKSAVEDLIKALSDREPDVRVLAAHVLGLIGPDAKAALPALEKATKDEDPRVGMIAAKTIKAIKGS
jgi:HEAT repeat protein